MAKKKPGFIIFSEAWYAAANSPLRDHATDEISFGADMENYPYDFALRWYPSYRGYAVRLEMFNDSWKALADPAFEPLFRHLARGYAGSVREVAGSLKELGFEDRTPRVRPERRTG